MPDDQQRPPLDETQAGIAGRITDSGARAVLVASLMAAIIALIVIATFKVH